MGRRELDTGPGLTQHFDTLRLDRGLAYARGGRDEKQACLVRQPARIRPTHSLPKAPEYGYSIANYWQWRADGIFNPFGQA